jgi:uncharacterized protein (TIGR00299 family) protein
MVLGALVDAGVHPAKLRKGLTLLPVTGYTLQIKKVKRAGLSCTKVDVIIKQSTERRKQNTDFKKIYDIEKIVQKSSLSKSIKDKGLTIFKDLFKAEARVHGKRYDTVHLHELGAVDCLVDIFGTLIGLDILGIEKIYASPINLGYGTVRTAHGTLPVPAPATAELLGKASVYSAGPDTELTTPTGAVLMKCLAERFGPMPAMQVHTIGTGAGGKNFTEFPNVLRVFLGEPVTYGIGEGTGKTITVIETNIDDMNPQVYNYVAEKLFEAGALDVYLTQIIMKKGRPGLKLSVLCTHEKRTELSTLLFRETSSIGIRFYEVQRDILERETRTVTTKLGKINVKVSRLGKEVVRITPEYEDCRKAAKKHNVSLLEVIESVTSQDYTDKRSKKKK